MSAHTTAVDVGVEGTRVARVGTSIGGGRSSLGLLLLLRSVLLLVLDALVLLTSATNLNGARGGRRRLHVALGRGRSTRASCTSGTSGRSASSNSGRRTRLVGKGDLAAVHGGGGYTTVLDCLVLIVIVAVVVHDQVVGGARLAADGDKRPAVPAGVVDGEISGQAAAKTAGASHVGKEVIGTAHVGVVLALVDGAGLGHPLVHVAGAGADDGVGDDAALAGVIVLLLNLHLVDAAGTLVLLGVADGRGRGGHGEAAAGAVVCIVVITRRSSGSTGGRKILAAVQERVVVAIATVADRRSGDVLRGSGFGSGLFTTQFLPAGQLGVDLAVHGLDHSVGRRGQTTGDLLIVFIITIVVSAGDGALGVGTMGPAAQEVGGAAFDGRVGKTAPLRVQDGRRLLARDVGVGGGGIGLIGRDPRGHQADGGILVIVVVVVLIVVLVLVADAEAETAGVGAAGGTAEAGAGRGDAHQAPVLHEAAVVGGVGDDDGRRDVEGAPALLLAVRLGEALPGLPGVVGRVAGRAVGKIKHISLHGRMKWGWRLCDQCLLGSVC